MPPTRTAREGPVSAETFIHPGTDVEGTPTLSVRDVSVDIHLRTHILHAVRDVSFDLHAGRTLALVGESGSGKSVTTLAIMRLLAKQARQTSGVITVHGKEGDTVLTDLDPKGKAIRAMRGRQIALIFQEPMSSLSPVHTIGSQIAEALRLHRGLDKRAAMDEAVRLLEQVEIRAPEEMVKRYTFEFSGGMRQRAMIAMALACDPDVLIADEPTTALDVTTEAEIMDLIKRLQQQRGMALMLITHDLGLVAEVADEVAVMRFGRIVERGPVDAIFHDTHTAYGKRLLAATMLLENPAESRGKIDISGRDPILSIRGLCKRFEAKNWRGKVVHALDAVRGANFDLYPGENLGIVGESGSGKTTLGRMLLRTIEPTSGSMLYRDAKGREQDVVTMGKAQLAAFHRDIRLVFQDPYSSLNPRMTIKQIIGEPLVVNGAHKGAALDERVGELLEMVGLDRNAMERYPHAFSGGQRQRVSIARAIALQPRIVIADEATSALDVSIRAQILELMIDLQKKLDLSFIFIAHDISVVRYFCDRVLVMHQGVIEEEGDAETICTTPTQPYTQRLISAVPNPDPRNKRMINRKKLAFEGA
ncbi:MAG: ABC transporter ATP-binding protein [Pseudomonadota bacterium]